LHWKNTPLNRENDIDGNDQDPLEQELLRLQPAKASEEFLVRLMQALPAAQAVQRVPAGHPVTGISWRMLLRWLAPATALAAVIATLNWRTLAPAPSAAKPKSSLPATTALKADNVEIDQHLVAAFDAVARLPGGEPVRFRCREWADEIVLHDKARGITIERRTPRLEVIPVALETY
jgi:hypothetical protein